MGALGLDLALLGALGWVVLAPLAGLGVVLGVLGALAGLGVVLVWPCWAR